MSPRRPHRQPPRAATTVVVLTVLALALFAAPAFAAGSLVPTVDCAVNNGDGTLTAYFGYANTTGSSLNEGVGSNNEFTPGPQFQGQPTTFNPGSYPEVVGVVFNPTVEPQVSWLLDGAIATASASTGACTAASTAPPSAVTATTATLNALVDSRGTPTTYQFDYGTTTAYGQATSAQSASGDDPSLGSATLSGLLPATTYHYRVQASNAMVGTTYGQDATFTTPPALAALGVSEPASDLTGTSATLNGVVNPQNATTTYQFQYGPTAAYGQSTPAATVSGADPQGVSGAITGLAAGTTYHYRLVATQSGTSTDGADESFTTPSAPSAPGVAELAVRAAQSPAPALRGRSLAYTFTVTNAGPATATGVSLSAILASSLHVQRVTVEHGSCATHDGVTCRLGDIAPGGHLTVVVTVRPSCAGRVRSLVFALGSQPDPNILDNATTIATTVTQPAHRSDRRHRVR